MNYPVQNATGAPIPPGALLNLYEFNQNTGVFKARLADALTLPSRPAHAVTLDGIAPGGTDTAYDTATTQANLNTTAIGAALSASVYLGANGGYLSAAPAGGLSQIVGTVAVLSPSVGSISVALTPDLRSIMPVPIQTSIAVDETGSAIAVDVLVAVNGIDDLGTSQTVVQADANAHIIAQYVTVADAVDEGNVRLARQGLSQANLNTNAGNVGDPVYLSATAGGWTLSAPATSDSFVQEVGRIVVKSTTVGQILWGIREPSLLGSQEVRASVAIALDGVTLDSAGAGTTAETKKYAESGLTPGAGYTMELDIADGATGNVDFVLAAAIGHFVVTDAHVIANSTNTAVANSVQVDNGTGGAHITDAISTNGKVAGDVVRAASIFPANWSIAGGGTIRVVRTRAGGANASKVVLSGYLAA